MLRSLNCLAASGFLLATIAVPTSFGQPASAPGTAIFEITGDGLCCAGCAKKVAAKLYTAPGIINVEANVANHTVTITAKPSSKLTLEKLWDAVEKAKGKPTRLTTAETAYTFSPRAKNSATEANRDYTIESIQLRERSYAERFAHSLRDLRGVESLTADLAKGQVIVVPALNSQLTAWALASALDGRQAAASTITGPEGRLTIEPVRTQAAIPTQSSRQ